MKNIQLSILLLFVTSIIVAQGFQGQATYMTKKSLNNTSTNTVEKTSKSDGISDEESKLLRAQLAKAFEKTYILDFNATESSYLKEVVVASQQKNKDESSVIVTFAGEDTPLYKNLKSRQYMQERENYKGKTNLVTDSLPTYDWKIDGETKKIGGYDCYKATAIVKVTTKQKADYEAKKLKDSKRKTVLFPAKEPKDLSIEAWFTNDIPVSHGPAKFWGLPGLILELTEDRTTYLCSKIILNSKDKKAIAVPKKGKVISQTDFDAAEKIAYDKMADENGIITHEVKD